MGITAGLTLLVAAALAVGPLAPAQAAPQPPKPPKPSITNLTPAAGPTAGGVAVVIKGRDLRDVEKVLFGTARATDIQVKSDRKIVVEAPPHAAGQVKVKVVTKRGTTKQTSKTRFTYTPPPPTLTFLEPTSGSTAGGATVTVTGTSFVAVTGVSFGGAPGTGVSVVSPTQLKVTAPAHAAGPVSVVVTTATGSSPVTGAARFTYVVPAPSLSQVSPRAGPTTGGTAVTLTGSQLAGVTAVRFGGADAATFSVASPTTVTATAPAHAAGPVSLSVTTPGGVAVLDDAFTYTPAPRLSEVSPSSGPTNGSTVTLTGTGFTAGTTVRFGPTLATDVQVDQDGTRLTAVTPDHAAGRVDVTVTTVGGSDTLLNGFVFVGEATLTSVSPPVGPAAGGRTVTLNGSGFTDSSLVLFGTTPSFEVTANLDGTELTALLPAHAAGTVNVFVGTEGDSTTLFGGFTYLNAPTLTGVSPLEGPATGGATVTLTGTGFRAGDTQVRFGGTLASAVSVNPGGTSLTATTPVRAAGVVDVSVTTSGGSVTRADAYTFVVAPTLTAVSPVAGPVAGGTTVTLTGTGFRAGIQASFGGTSATVLSVGPGGTSLTVTAPARVAGTVGVAVTTPGGSATLAGAYTYAPAPTLTSVTPSAGPVPGGPTVTLTGTGFRPGDTQVSFGGTPVTAVSVAVGGTSLTATAPAHAAGTVDVSVTTAGGSATLAGAYTYSSSPTVTSVSPSAGPVAGGTTVTLTGSGFRPGDTQVSFGGTPATAVAVAGGGTSLTATAPAHAAGTVDVSVTTAGGSATLANAYTYAVAPTLTAVSPVAGPVAGGTTVTLTGTGFRAGDTQVSFGGTPAAGLVVAPEGTSLIATTPAHAAGAVAVTVTTSGGSATAADAYTFAVAPTLTDVNPAAGPVTGGTTLTLTGTGFRVGDTRVSIGGNPATMVSVDPGGTGLTATAPAHVAGVVNVSVSTAGGSATLDSSFTYVGVPTLTDVSPAAGPVAGGTTVTLTGTGFRAGVQVSFGGTPATGILVNADGTVLTAVAPAHAAGTVAVGVTTPGGSATLSAAYTYAVEPTLDGLTPVAGPVTGGTTVTLIGGGFQPGSQVRFGNALATDVQVDPDGTQLTAVTPARVAGVADVSVITPGGTAALDDAYTYVVSPTLTGITPAIGPVAGGTAVTLTGTGLRPGTQVSVGGAAASNILVNADGTLLTATTPTHAAGPVDVTATTAGGTATLTDGFTYAPVPTVTGVSPAAGPVAGGTSVTVSGSGFRAGAQVSFGGTAATDVVVDPDGTTLTATTPAHAAGPVDVSVTTVGGSGTGSGAFTYAAAPSVTGVSPTSGPASGGQTVTLTGTGFRSGDTLVSFDGTPATGVVVANGGTTLTAVTPAHEPGAVTISVTTSGGSDSLVSAFTYIAAPDLVSVSPESGPEAGGTTVTLTGTDLIGTTDVTFGGVPASGVSVLSDTQVTAVAPASLAGTVAISVTTAGGSDSLTSAFTYIAAPTVTSLTPSSGTETGGTTVTLTGTGLTGTTAVTFGGLDAASLTVVSDTEIVVVTPPQAAAAVDVQVTTAGGSTVVTSGFTYLADPPPCRPAEASPGAPTVC